MAYLIVKKVGVTRTYATKIKGIPESLLREFVENTVNTLLNSCKNTFVHNSLIKVVS